MTGKSVGQVLDDVRVRIIAMLSSGGLTLERVRNHLFLRDGSALFLGGLVMLSVAVSLCFYLYGWAETVNEARQRELELVLSANHEAGREERHIGVVAAVLGPINRSVRPGKQREDDWCSEWFTEWMKERKQDTTQWSKDCESAGEILDVLEAIALAAAKTQTVAAVPLAPCGDNGDTSSIAPYANVAFPRIQCDPRTTKESRAHIMPFSLGVRTSERQSIAVQIGRELDGPVFRKLMNPEKRMGPEANRKSPGLTLVNAFFIGADNTFVVSVPKGRSIPFPKPTKVFTATTYFQDLQNNPDIVDHTSPVYFDYLEAGLVRTRCRPVRLSPQSFVGAVCVDHSIPGNILLLRRRDVVANRRPTRAPATSLASTFEMTELRVEFGANEGIRNLRLSLPDELVGENIPETATEALGLYDSPGLSRSDAEKVMRQLVGESSVKELRRGIQSTLYNGRTFSFVPLSATEYEHTGILLYPIEPKSQKVFLIVLVTATLVLVGTCLVGFSARASRRARESTLLQRAFGTSPFGVVAVDEYDRIVSANEAAEMILGRSLPRFDDPSFNLVGDRAGRPSRALPEDWANLIGRVIFDAKDWAPGMASENARAAIDIAELMLYAEKIPAMRRNGIGSAYWAEVSIGPRAGRWFYCSAVSLEDALVRQTQANERAASELNRALGVRTFGFIVAVDEKCEEALRQRLVAWKKQA